MADLLMAAPQAVAHAKPIIHTVYLGVSYMTCAISVAIAAILSGGLGYYIGTRGIANFTTEVKNDVKEVKAL